MLNVFRILIADDNLINRKIMDRIFQQLGFQTVSVASGLDVISLMEHEDFDIFLLDINMPGMNGFETAKAIRAKYKDEKRPLIFAVSMSAHEENKQKCLEAGMNDILSKNFLPEEIADKLEQWGIRIPTEK